MVLVSTKDKRKIYEFLLQEGVFAVKKVSENFLNIIFILIFRTMSVLTNF